MDHDPTIAGVLARMRRGDATPVQEIERCYDLIAAHGDPALFIAQVPRAQAIAAARELERRGPAGLPLFGVPFAIKDNIDLAGVPTTAGCPAYAYTPDRSATVVERLIAAGAIPVGKTNLDQFATGLVGVRSPYGVPRNPCAARVIPGGSSSGSACAVSAGLVPFALGTDTAGSGRVPAGFTNIVGLKPTRGLVSTRGVVPAVRSLDCVSVFALTVADAWQALDACAGFDAEDDFSRQVAPAGGSMQRLAVITDAQLDFHGDRIAERAYRQGLDRLCVLGCTLVPIDFAPFAETARLLYEGPWVSERHAVVGDFIASHREACDPVVAGIIGAAAGGSAPAVFTAFHRLAALRRGADGVFSTCDGLVVPTTPTLFTVDEVRADPVRRNSVLGTYTNFANLLDLCAIAVPNGHRDDGLPSGLTLLAPAGADRPLAVLAERFQIALGGFLGATVADVPTTAAIADTAASTTDRIEVAVFGAHLRGQPLNHQLLALGGTYVAEIRTAAAYRLHALPTSPPKPGLVRVPSGGAGIVGECWALPAAGFGRLVAAIPPPLAIGTIELDDGRLVKGFLCEPHATAGTPDITSCGGWLAHLGAAR
jgi:allophanate hydrolase